MHPAKQKDADTDFIFASNQSSSMDTRPVLKSEDLKHDHDSSVNYFPLYDTMRLYAGWLLAWYGVVFALGSYQSLKPLPFHVPYADSLFLSPLVLSFTFASYLFLLCSSIHKSLLHNKASAIVLAIAGLALFFAFRMNVQ